VSSYIDFVKSMGKLNSTCKGPWDGPGAKDHGMVPVPRTMGWSRCQGPWDGPGAKDHEMVPVPRTMGWFRCQGAWDGPSAKEPVT
jgi:hypothetical protein